MSYLRQATQRILSSKQNRFALLLIVVFLGVLLGILIYRNMQFRLVKIDPSLNAIPDSTPTIYFEYNKQLDTHIQAAFTPTIRSSVSVSGKVLTIHLGQWLVAGSTFTLTVSGIKSTSGATLPNEVYRLRVTTKPFNELSPQVQQSILQHQDIAITNKDTIPLDNTDALVDHGVTTYQIDSLRQALLVYEQQTKQHITQATIARGSVTAIARDPNSSEQVFTLNFSLILNQTTYRAAFQYSGISVGGLKIFDQTSSRLVFDSGPIDATKL